MVFVLENIAEEPEEMPHYAEFHWGAYCLPKDSFSEESVVYKGFKITSDCGTSSKYRVNKQNKLNFSVNKGLPEADFAFQ